MLYCLISFKRRNACQLKFCSKNLTLSVILLFMLVISFSCVPNTLPLTEAKFQQWLSAYRMMKQRSIDFDLKGNNNSIPIKNPKEIEQIVRNAGFKDFTEFMLVTQKIMTSFSIVQSSDYIESMEKFNSPANEHWKEIFSNPDIPEQAKKEALKQFEQSKKEWDKNMQFANPILNFTKKLTDPISLEIVKKHQKELLEIITE